MPGSGYQMHTQGRRPAASATERLRDSSGVTQPVRAYSSDTLSGGPHRPDPCWTSAHPFPWF